MSPPSLPAKHELHHFEAIRELFGIDILLKNLISPQKG